MMGEDGVWCVNRREMQKVNETYAPLLIHTTKYHPQKFIAASRRRRRMGGDDSSGEVR